ncbi:MAG: LacI family transcriptional regulator [Actinobacteria bacterium]|nr:LacI family transcriptional regulator [Actinomycetota bacterium]
MPTAYDVAAKAGVSVGTVSRYLTGNGYVSAAARERIAAAISELGYIQNRAAASLTTKRTGLLGFVVSQLKNPFTAEVASALGQAARARGYGVVLADSGGDPNQAIDAVELLRSHEVEGLVVTPPESPEYNAALVAAARTMPVVGIGLHTTPSVTDLVTVDTRSGAQQAVTYLIELGHTRIAYIGSSTMASGRYQAYRTTLEAHGLPCDPELIVLGSLDREAGHQATTRLFAQDRPPTAVFAANDAVALGVVQAAHSLGIAVPTQLSVIGCDNVDLAAHAIPPLTTVAQPMALLGQTALELLWQRLGPDPAGHSPRTVTLSCELVIRESCAPPASPGRPSVQPPSERTHHGQHAES